MCVDELQNATDAAGESNSKTKATGLFAGFIRFSPLKLTTAIVPSGNPNSVKSFYKTM